MLSKQFFKNNRKKLQENFKQNELALVHAKDPFIKGDGPYYSQIDSNLFYLTGISQVETICLIDSQQTYLFISRPNPSKELWEGKQLRKEQAKTISGIENIYYRDEFEEKFSSLIGRKKIKLYTQDFSHEISTPSGLTLLEKLSKKHPKITFVSINPLIKPLRQIKQKQEIQELKKAIAITKKGFFGVMKNMGKYSNETNIEAELSYVYTNNFSKHSYHPIVGSGGNATTLHYLSNNKSLKKNELVLIDSGAESNNYKADITRTLPVSGKFTKRQKQIYNAVLSIQEYAFSLLKPGIERKEYERKITQKTGEKLIELNLLSENKLEESLRNVLPFSPHSTSHFLGLDTHDLGDYSSCIQEGEVITVEPGIYIKKENIGIRIEDNVLITKNGCRILSKNIPKTIEEIEKTMQ